MALGYPAWGDIFESQQFGPALPTAAGYLYQPAMYITGRAVAYWQSYKGWPEVAHVHNGLDVAGVVGTPLLALEAGKVTYAGWRDNGGGNVCEVEIRPGTRYTFNHCSSVLVGVGQIVKKGQAIARIGATGAATGPHCHTSLDIDEVGSDGYGRTLMWNPKLWMSGGPYAGDARVAPVYAAPAPPPPTTTSGYGLAIWPLYARSTAAGARGYAYRIFVNAGKAPVNASPGRWGASTWPLYARLSYLTASSYALRIFRNNPNYKP